MTAPIFPDSQTGPFGIRTPSMMWFSLKWGEQQGHPGGSYSPDKRVATVFDTKAEAEAYIATDLHALPGLAAVKL